MPSKKNRGKPKNTVDSGKSDAVVDSEVEAATIEPAAEAGCLKDVEDVRKKIEETWLGKRYEIHLTDGRKIRGVLTCTDRDANMIFYKADERWPDGDDLRWIGQTLIAKRHVTRMFLLKDPPETRI